MSDGGWGGARAGSGPKPAGYVPSEDRQDFESERAKHERVKREQREFKLAVEQGRYVSREAVKQAVATALSILTQSLRSVPDNIERTLALSPEAVEAVAQQIDAGLTEVAAAFRSIAEN